MTHHRIPAPLRSLAGNEAIVVCSPGRINLIGEHTDYNDGFVLPAAIDKAVYVAVEKRNNNRITLHSVNFNETVETGLDDIRPTPGHWCTYILGVVDQLRKKGFELKGFKLSVYGDIPLGAGLSSSAALECATAFALKELFMLTISRLELAGIAQLAEHEFAGVQCGIMDQFASLFGKKENLIRLDCRSLGYEYFPARFGGYKIVLFDSQVKHSLASTEYNVRRGQCEEGVAIIKSKYPVVQSLRDVTPAMIHECLADKKVLFKRCNYVVQENQRVLDGCNDLLNGNLPAFGKRMFASHKGLSEEYEVSCKELDLLVNAVQTIPAVTGARMMGGGFGGCTINIIEEGAVDRTISHVKEQYRRSIQKELSVYVVSIEDGTSVIT